jgi:hypothetical protein
LKESSNIFFDNYMKTLIYEYGAFIDKECLPAVTIQFDKARYLYNAIIEIINKARADADRYVKENEPAVAEKMAAIETLNQRFQEAKAVNDEPQMAVIAAERRETWKAVKPLLKEARKKHESIISEIYSVIGKKKECLTYQARCDAVANGLGSSTADDVLDTALKAWDKVKKEGGRLSFRSAKDRKQDHINVRFTCGGGIDTKDLLTRDHNFLCLNPPAEIGDRRYGTFKFRLGPAKAETYATGSWQFHRPFPEGSRVTTVRLILRKIGPTTRWALQFQLSVESYQPIEVKPNRKPLAALHLGFNLADNGYLRLGAIADHEDPGFAKFLDMPESIPLDLFRSEQMQKLRDEKRDAIHAAIKSISPADNWEPEIADEWNAIKKLPAQHVTAARIVALYRKIECMEWNVAGTLKLEAAWMLQDFSITDYKLYRQQSHIRTKALNRRKNFYRQVALDLVREYQAIAISRYDLRDMAKRIKDNGERNELGQIARHARHSAALFQLIECIKWACERSGSVCIEHDDMQYTKHCASCGAEHERNSDLLLCECGLEVDIKANSAANLYTLRLKTVGDDTKEILSKKAAKEQAAKDKKLGKLEKMQAKRKLTSKNREDVSGNIAA